MSMTTPFLDQVKPPITGEVTSIVKTTLNVDDSSHIECLAFGASFRYLLCGVLAPGQLLPKEAVSDPLPKYLL